MGGTRVTGSVRSSLERGNSGPCIDHLVEKWPTDKWIPVGEIPSIRKSGRVHFPYMKIRDTNCGEAFINGFVDCWRYAKVVAVKQLRIKLNELRATSFPHRNILEKLEASLIV